MGARQSTGSGTVSSSNSPRLYTNSSVPGSSSRSNDTSSSSRGNSGRPITVPPLDLRQRTRSLSNVMSNGPGSSQGPSLLSMAGLPFGLSSGSPDSDTSTEDVASFGRVFSAHSLPVHIVPFNGIKCPVCSKTILTDDVEVHLVMCLTKPRISYNEDTLTEEKGECVICLEDMSQGQTIARLPCLCIYHKSCIDEWFKVNRSCPEHPSD